MGTETTTTIAYELKRVYGNKLTKLWADHAMTYNMFFKSKRPYMSVPGGAGFYFATQQSDPQGVGGRGESMYLPEPMTSDGVQGVVTPQGLYSVGRMSGLSMEAARGNTMSFVNSKSNMVKRMYMSLVNDMNRQCHGDGTGLLGTLSTTATPSTTTAWTATFNNDRGVRYIKKGMVCDFYNSTAIDTSASSVRVSSVNPNTRVVTFESGDDLYRAYHPLTAAQSYSNGTGTIASGSFLVRYGARAASHVVTTTYELAGLEACYDDGTVLTSFEGITIANDPEFKANRIHNSGTNRELSIDLMLAAMDMTNARSGETCDLIRMGIGQRRKYFALLEGDRRYNSGKLQGGYEELQFAQNGAVRIVVDPVTQPNKIYFEVDGAIKKYELTSIGWGGFDPNFMHWREDYDEGTMYLRTYTNLGVENRPALTRLEDLTEPTGGTTGSMPF